VMSSRVDLHGKKHVDEGALEQQLSTPSGNISFSQVVFSCDRFWLHATQHEKHGCTQNKLDRNGPGLQIQPYMVARSGMQA